MKHRTWRSRGAAARSPAGVTSLILGLASLLAIGCEQAAPSGGPGEALGEDALARGFPSHAERVLAGAEPWRAVRGGFSAGAAGDPVLAIERRGGLSLVLPERGEEAIAVQAPGGFSVRVRESGARGAAAVRGGAVTFERAGGTSFWTVTATGFEEWLHLGAGVATGRAPAASWEIEGGQVREVEGGVEIAGEDGLAAVRVTAPVAYAAGERSVPVKLTVSGARIELWVDAGGEEVLVDPVWATTGSLSASRYGHVAALLPATGKILVAGGLVGGVTSAASELYDPATGGWSPGAPLTTARHYARAVVLSNGKVLVTGGVGASGTSLKGAELYDPGGNSWSDAGQMAQSRNYHSAVYLPNVDKVIVLGGYGHNPVTGYLSSAEIYTPSSNSWTSAATMSAIRYGNTATYVPSVGKVLVSGGYDAAGAPVGTAALYNPVNNTWTNPPSIPSMVSARVNHAASLIATGKVLLTGGHTGAAITGTTEIYDAAANTFTAGPAMTTARHFHTATVLSTGDVIVAAGIGAGNTNPTATELYRPVTNTWSPAGSLAAGRQLHEATAFGSGKVLLSGGYPISLPALSSAEVFDSLQDTWVNAGSIGTGRYNHAAALLSSGKVLIAGGHSSVVYYSTTKIYDPGAGTWTSGPSMAQLRDGPAAVRLNSGKVLVAGGYTGSVYTPTAEVYDPAGSFAATSNNMSAGRVGHTATLLPDGTALVLGGDAGGASLTNADRYNPSSNAWTTITSMPISRSGHTATRLADGKILVAGGFGGSPFSGYLTSCHLYNPTTGLWTATGSMAAGRANHTATLLANGYVLVTGGRSPGYLASAEYYRPDTGLWYSAGTMSAQRTYHAATLMNDGKVLVAGGYNGGYLQTAELYTPSSNSWVTTTPMIAQRDLFTLTTVGSGSALAAGGFAGGGGGLTGSELYNPVVVDDGNVCTVDSWDPVLHRVNHAPVANGTACNDGNACTQSDTCQSGVCAGANPVVCTASDQCHSAGTCNTSTGLCSNPAKANGSACNDSNACTQTDTCQSGACTGANPVICTAADQCHSAGTCDTSTGACSNPIKANGSACNDSNACTQTDTCQSGACAGANPVVCTASDQCHDAGSCNTSTGVCSNPAKANGSGCNDGDACTQTDTCQSGACAGANPVLCEASDLCHVASCDAQTGACGETERTCLYAESSHQSPVRGDPGDLLLLAGDNFDVSSGGTVVVYQKLTDTMAPPVTPAAVPGSNSATTGVITPFLREANGVTIRLLGAPLMTEGQSYALWAATPKAGGGHVFSNPVLLNDARPMWISPGARAGNGAPSPSYPYLFATAPRPGVGRTLRIVGRNLQPAPGHVTQVRLVPDGGSALAPLTAADDLDPDTTIERYQAVVTLPSLAANDYTVQVSRDGASWVPAPGKLTILADPPAIGASSSFSLGAYGDAENACDPCDDEDDTLCLARAIHAANTYAAAQQAPATVLVEGPTCPGGRPTWILDNCQPNNNQGSLTDDYFGAPYNACTVYWGMGVGDNVSVIADPEADERPTIETREGFDAPVLDSSANDGTCGAVGASCVHDTDCCSPGSAQVCMHYGPGYAQARCEIRQQGKQHVLQLNGRNVVAGLRFHDTYWRAFAAVEMAWGPIVYPEMNNSVSIQLNGHDIAITDNFFDDVTVAVDAWPAAMPGGGAGTADLVMTNNAFGAYTAAWSLGTGVDVVVRDNVFWPGAQIASLAGGLLAGRRVDVSHNELDGTSAILTPDGNVASYSGPWEGWRAGFFFPTFGPQEHVLAAQNHVVCTGTRPGQDGEAITTDSNGDIVPLRRGVPVLASPAPSATQVTIAWPAPHNAASGAPSSFVGRWLRIDHGPGLGQARRITGAVLDDVNSPTTLTITVSPPFDVPPAATDSWVLMGNQAWQLHFVDNVIDNTCVTSESDLSDLHPDAAGVISIYGSGVDCAIEGNQQTNARGITLWAGYLDATYTDDPDRPYWSHNTAQYFVDVRNNRIVGQFGGLGHPDNRKGSGIELFAYSSARTQTGNVVTVLPNENYPGFGVSVAHNTLVDAGMADPTTWWNTDPDGLIAIASYQYSEQSSSPSYLDTLIFSNDLDGSPALGAQSVGGAISNTCGYDGTVPAANYSRPVILCDNTSTDVASPVLDCPPSGQPTGIVNCP